ncbi:MAG: glycosyltransferase family 2 protein, partial [Acidimicrobiia bacterium]|nr:glycosyltransferase family 2 protein [Acidimicrobiia bacterium]
MTSAPQVTVCIPTYQSESFIERTLGHASTQTHQNLRILVSVDQSEDATEEICRRYAAADSRFEVYAHESRLGWAHNLNFLLDKVESEFFFIYFHDDI